MLAEKIHSNMGNYSYLFIPITIQLPILCWFIHCRKFFGEFFSFVGFIARMRRLDDYEGDELRNRVFSIQYHAVV